MPYSSHSSLHELENFLKALAPEKLFFTMPPDTEENAARKACENRLIQCYTREGKFFKEKCIVNPYKDGTMKEEQKEEVKDPLTRTPFREIDEVIRNPDLPIVPPRRTKATEKLDEEAFKAMEEADTGKSTAPETTVKAKAKTVFYEEKVTIKAHELGANSKTSRKKRGFADVSNEEFDMPTNLSGFFYNGGISYETNKKRKPKFDNI